MYWKFRTRFQIKTSQQNKSFKQCSGSLEPFVKDFEIKRKNKF